jgi:hypothetical protein
MTTKYECFAGNYGSGKTELAINCVLRAGEAGIKTAVVDLDTVNLFFQSSSKRDMLEQKGIDVFGPTFAGSNVDVAVLPGNISGVLGSDRYDFVSVDVGGDPSGAKTISRYHDEISKRREQYTFNFVVNALRPQTNSVQSTVALVQNIEAAGRVKFDYIVNNTNLLDATTPEQIIEGHRLLSEVSKELGIPVRYASVTSEIAEQIRIRPSGENFEIEEIDIYMRPDWFGAGK